VLSWLARRFSADAVLPYLERAEHADASLYEGDPDATAAMAVDERSHARVLTRLRNHGARRSSAAARNDQLVARHPEAFADHAADFWRT
jgi:hypothetical protein